MLTVVLFWIFILSVAIQCGYALYFFTRIFYLPGRNEREEIATRYVSVIICARNEARNLELNLPSILAQRYTNEAGKPMYEVVVVNDASTDDTEAVLQCMELQYDHLRHVTIDHKCIRTFKGKKFALSKGVAASNHDLLLLTDADCKASSEDWIYHIVTPMAKGKEIVAGYGAHYAKGGLLNAFIRWETVHTFLQYATYALAGKPYMAVGRNLACTREVFLKAQQSEVWNELPSGDDDLLIRTGSTAHNTGIVADSRSFTFSEGRDTWSDWLKQKQRHVSTGKYYKPAVKALLGIYALSHALSWLLFFVLLYWHDWIMVFIIFMMRCSVYWTIWLTTASKLQDRKLFQWVPLCDIGWAVYNFALSPYIIWKNKQRWK